MHSYLGLNSVVNPSSQNNRNQVTKETGQDRCKDKEFVTFIGR